MQPQSDGNDVSNKKEQTKVPPLAANSSVHNIVTSQVQQIVNNCMRRSTTSLDGKTKVTVTSERLAQLRKIVETAIKEHKTFTVRGNIVKCDFIYSVAPIVAMRHKILFCKY